MHMSPLERFVPIHLDEIRAAEQVADAPFVPENIRSKLKTLVNKTQLGIGELVDLADPGEVFGMTKERMAEMDMGVPAAESHVDVVREHHEWFATLTAQQDIANLIESIMRNVSTYSHQNVA